MADLTQFDIGSAQRIARVVRQVEQEPRRARPLTFDAVQGGQQKAFRVCTFTGSWSVGSLKTVTFKYQTTTPNTVSATNLFLPLPNNGTRDCAIAKDGTAWFLLQSQMDTATLLTGASLTDTALEFTRISGFSFGTAATVQISVTTCSTAAI